MPPRMPVTAAGCSVRPLVVAQGRDERDDHLHDRARAEAEQERGDRRVVGGRADPGAEHRRRAREQPERGQLPSDARSRASGATIASPSVVLWIANPTTRNAPRASAPAEYAAPIATPSPRLWSPMPTATSSGASRPTRGGRATRTRPPGTGTPPPRRRTPAPRRRTPASPRRPARSPSKRRVDGEERQQPDRQRHQRPQPLRRHAPQPRQPEHPERDRDHAHVDAQQRHQPEEPGVGGRRLDRDRDLVHDRPAGRGDQRDLVGLALDPRLDDLHRRGLEPPDRVLGAA